LSLSVRQRLDNVDLALSLLLREAEGKWFIHAFVGRGDPAFAEILATTWEELHRRRYIAQIRLNLFVLTGYGWRIALEKANKKNEFNEDLGLLCASLKARVVGRTCPAVANVEDLAKETGLPDYFIRNAIDGELIRRWLNRHAAKWADRQFHGTLIAIPIDFGHTILT
jgi:hypothetical protein